MLKTLALYRLIDPGSEWRKVVLPEDAELYWNIRPGNCSDGA